LAGSASSKDSPAFRLPPKLCCLTWLKY
jgi:hypothetical protein